MLRSKIECKITRAFISFFFNHSEILIQYVYWHSTAHVLGEALERVYGGELCYGPPVDNGFYYDMHMENQSV